MKSKREPLEVEMKGSGTGPLKRERRRIACCVSTLRFFLNQTVCFSFWIIIQKQPKVQHLNTHSKVTVELVCACVGVLCVRVLCVCTVYSFISMLICTHIIRIHR